ncbi:MAG: hypothetical protein A2913_01810 [Parcubacteria group bacterium RIFCSPLOWO2_01_FULL_40_65]|nr:MAG: hypothetical protein A2734_02205 [Parcubacteria group bacterium RIFCSPHIGHO2_01_FULL_40_30]OHB19860.1 MAG: hypothetical protein A3D40_01565 [Parcubacteria group bacterium RIFCSPHIGHO2_02_FULL_40_12]OHB21571.1 MAG: hypothetical protein A2913_01810 [Parcubacteria group bacterium RIFCSPLOWO2_01_FULL_40_65]OHB23503.1 MAG: hypothetical protein A3I22_01815 [Parcubacteria group bacterium RIFCSPLOWO2_02_FULL_40_12]OHB24022.1 MAG: hypothetical protein A3F96_02105 [Parcubacteria group bacterium R
MQSKAIFLIGPPGSGKGTQAELLAKELGFYHFEISKVIEKKFKEADLSDKEIAHQKEHWIAGELVHPELVAKWFREEVENLKNRASGFVFSGSARTLEETKQNLTYLSEIYSKENIGAVEIKLSEEESVKRNSARRICVKNRHPIPNFPEFANIKVCPEDGSEIITRELDKPEIIKERYRVYLRDTQPVIDYFKKSGYKMKEVNGEQPIENVFRDIKASL